MCKDCRYQAGVFRFTVLPPRPNVSLIWTGSCQLSSHHTVFLSISHGKIKDRHSYVFHEEWKSVCHCGSGYSHVTNTAQQVLMHIVLNVLDLSYYETSHSKNYDQNSKDM